MGRNELSANAIAASTHRPHRCSENVFTYRTKRLRVTGATISPAVNRPHCPVHNYDRDGAMRLDDNRGGSVNYEPNSFGGPIEDHRNCTSRATFGVDPVRWTVCRLGRFRLVEHLRLIGDRRYIADTRMAASGIVPALDITEDRHTGLGLRSEPAACQQLTFQCCEEALAHGVVVGRHRQIPWMGARRLPGSGRRTPAMYTGCLGRCGG
jgi:hypothetical protein